MRYTTIHHDVRIRFSLTPIEYMVCDSIHQLSHQRPTQKPNTKIAEFLGVDEGSVRNAKNKLTEMGLLTITDDGIKTTDLWYRAVTFAQNGGVRNNSEEIRKDSESYIYINKYNPVDAEASKELRIVKEEDKSDEKFKVKQVVEVIKTETGRYSKHWEVHKSQRSSCVRLFDGKGIEKIRRAIQYYLEHKDQFYFRINSPLDLETRWFDLLDLKEKNGD